MVESPHVVVVGAGIAGLSAAYRLRQEAPDLAITLVEADDRIGGKIVTEHVDGFVIEGGPDSLVTFKPQALALAFELGILERLRPADDSHQDTYVMRRGRLRPLPEGMTGFVPRKAWPMARSRLLSPLGKCRLALEFAVPPRRHGDDETLESFISRRLGRQVYRRLVEPMVAGIFAADPARLSLLATMPHLRAAEVDHGGMIRAMLAERRARRRSERGDQGPSRAAKRPPSVVAPISGMKEIVEALARNLPSVAIALNTKVVSIDRAKAGYLVHAETGGGDQASVMPADAVILAVPAPAAANAVDDLDTSLAATLRKTPYASTVTVTMGFRTADVSNPLRGHGYLVPAQEKRTARACTWSSSKFPGRAPKGHVLLRVSLGGADRPALDQRTDDELLATARDEVAATLGIRTEPVVSRVYRWTGVMPQYTLGHLDRVASLEGLLDAHPGIFVAGSGYHGLSISDCIGSGQRAAQATLSRLERT